MNEDLRTAIELLKRLISTPSLSRDEAGTADIIEAFLKEQGCEPLRKGNNVWVRSFIDERLPVVLLNSHHDTVRPVASWTRDPFAPTISDGRLYGLGSNDAGASLVSLLMTWLRLTRTKNRPFNLIFAASAEEEVTGQNGMAALIGELGHLDLAIVGEPTQMQMAVAEKGLMVLDCKTVGRTGHAARNEGINAIYLAMDDMAWFRTFRFPKSSPLLGEVKMTVSIVQAGYQHNIVPDTCSYVVDVRTNEHYSNTEALEIIRNHVKHSEVTPRSTHINSSSIAMEHPFVQKGLALGLTAYGSPTTSDQARIPFTSVKIGPGDSARSHTADEFVCLDEIANGIDIYCQLLENLRL